MGNWKNPFVIEYIRYMGTDPVLAIKKECNYLLKLSGQENININHNPVDIDKIASLLGLKDFKYNYSNQLDIQGHLIQRSKNDIKIELNQNLRNLYKYRFVIAHEIGHLIIKSKISKPFSNDEISLIKIHSYEEEILCHYFASELLIPESIFNSEIKDHELENDLISNLAMKFKVSDYQIINKLIYSNKNYIGIYWKYKSLPNFVSKSLRVNNIFPDSRIRELPFIPINASAKSLRFNPNIILESFKTNKSLSRKINIKNFGELSGQFDVFVYNPVISQTFFESERTDRKFDLISILKV